jgi:hypothetical protein
VVGGEWEGGGWEQRPVVGGGRDCTEGEGEVSQQPDAVAGPLLCHRHQPVHPRHRQHLRRGVNIDSSPLPSPPAAAAPPFWQASRRCIVSANLPLRMKDCSGGGGDPCEPRQT